MSAAERKRAFADYVDALEANVDRARPHVRPAPSTPNGDTTRPPIVPSAPAVPESAFIDPREVVVDARTGVPRQAGATTPEGRFVVAFRQRAEQSLFVFARGVMGRGYLTRQLHKPTCEWLQTCPPRRNTARKSGRTPCCPMRSPPHR